MRNLIRCVALAFVLPVIAVINYSCSNDDAFLKADIPIVDLPAVPGEAVTVNISSSEEWTFFKSGSWIIVEKFDDHMTVTAKPNEGDKRDGYIGLSTSRKGAIVQVLQKAAQVTPAMY